MSPYCAPPQASQQEREASRPALPASAHQQDIGVAQDNNASRDDVGHDIEEYVSRNDEEYVQQNEKEYAWRGAEDYVPECYEDNVDQDDEYVHHDDEYVHQDDEEGASEDQRGGIDEKDNEVAPSGLPELRVSVVAILSPSSPASKAFCIMFISPAHYLSSIISSLFIFLPACEGV